MKTIDEKKFREMLKTVSMDVRFVFEGSENNMQTGISVNGEDKSIKTLTDEELVIFYQLASCLRDAAVSEQVSREIVTDVLKKMYNTPMAKA